MTNNVAAQTKLLFTRLANEAAKATSANVLTLEKCWSSVLSEDVDSFYSGDFYEALAMCARQLDQLDAQILASTALDQAGKSEARRNIRGLKDCLRVESLSHNMTNFKDKIGTDKLGFLNILSVALNKEFSEPTISESEADRLGAEINELIKSAKNADIDKSLKALLIKHLQFLLYALRNMDILGVEGVYEAVGRALVATHRMPERESTTPDASSIKQRIKRLLGKLLTTLHVVKDLDEGITALEHIADEGSNLLQDI